VLGGGVLSNLTKEKGRAKRKTQHSRKNEEEVDSICAVVFPSSDPTNDVWTEGTEKQHQENKQELQRSRL